jgi:threonine dehydratase
LLPSEPFHSAEVASHPRVSSETVISSARDKTVAVPIRDLDAARRLVGSIRQPSPLERADGLAGGAKILLKREDLGPNGSFKWRGALCALSHLAHERGAAVVTASTGNHGAATAWAADQFGLEAHVVVPEGANELKCRLIEDNGAILHRSGADLDAADEYAHRLAAAIGAPYFEDGALAAQLLGTATIGSEIAAADPDVVIAPLAVGALVGGIGEGLAAAGSAARLYGVQAASHDAIARRIQGRPPAAEPGRTFADGLADVRVLEPAFGACREHLSGVAVVNEVELEAAVRDLWTYTGIVAEGAGAAALAGLRSLDLGDRADLRVILVISGRNLDPQVARRIVPDAVVEAEALATGTEAGSLVPGKGCP